MLLLDEDSNPEDEIVFSNSVPFNDRVGEINQICNFTFIEFVVNTYICKF